MDLKSVLMGLSFAAIWASAFTSTRIAVVEMPPLLALVIRFGISAVIAIGLAWAMGQSMRLSRAEWRTVIVFGLCQNALYLGLNWVGMQWVEASAASIIASMMPLLVAFAGWAFLRQPLRPQAVAGLVVGIVGVVIIMSVRLSQGMNLLGLGLCLAAVVALTVATLAVRGAGGGPNVMMIVGLQMAVGAVALVLPSAVLEWGRPFEWSGRLVGARCRAGGSARRSLPAAAARSPAAPCPARRRPQGAGGRETRPCWPAASAFPPQDRGA